MIIQLTDAQLAFAHTAEGRSYLSDAKRRHDMREAHKGRDAQPWTDALEAEAVRDGAVNLSRATIARAVVDARAPAAIAAAETERATAYAMRVEKLRNGWKS